jgi:hypothetical protein
VGHDNRRLTIPLVAYDELGISTGSWLRLSVVEFGRGLLERVPPEMPEALITRVLDASRTTLIALAEGAGQPMPCTTRHRHRRPPAQPPTSPPRST